MAGWRSAWRDERVRAGLIQALIGLLALALVGVIILSVLRQMALRGLTPGFGFLDHVAGFRIGEGIPFTDRDSYKRAFVVGLVNSARVAVAGIVLATALGFGVALGRLSGNVLASRLCSAYVEVFRNTPLLVQLIFWFRAVVLPLPSLAQSEALWPRVTGDGQRTALLFLSQRGFAITWPRSAVSAAWWWVVVLGALGTIWLARRWRRRVEARTGAPARGVAWSVALAGLWLVLAWRVMPQPPFGLDAPVIERFRYRGGMQLTPEFTALLLGLVTYTAAYIAEVFRTGLQAVARGQREAALAVGLREPQVLWLVILPQALRVIIPPLTSQFVNLAKNSSLAIYIGYPDLFNVSLTIGNQTGQFVVLTAMVMAVYLTLSLLTSLVMNLYNRHIQLVER